MEEDNSHNRLWAMGSSGASDIGGRVFGVRDDVGGS